MYYYQLAGRMAELWLDYSLGTRVIAFSLRIGIHIPRASAEEALLYSFSNLADVVPFVQRYCLILGKSHTSITFYTTEHS